MVDTAGENQAVAPTSENAEGNPRNENVFGVMVGRTGSAKATAVQPEGVLSANKVARAASAAGGCH